MPITDTDGNYFICPKCRTIFLDYDFHQKRFRCLKWDCGWIEKQINETKNHNELIKETWNGTT